MKSFLVVILTLLLAIPIIARNYKKKNWLETWIDGVLVNLFASAILICLGFLFQKEIYNLFQKTKVSVSSTCHQVDRKSNYNCEFVLTNETESSLDHYKIALHGEKDEAETFRFQSCTPDLSQQEQHPLLPVSRGSSETICIYRVSLAPYAQVRFKLAIEEDSATPRVVLLQ